MRNIAGSSAQMTKNINIEKLRPGLEWTGVYWIGSCSVLQILKVYF